MTKELITKADAMATTWYPEWLETAKAIIVQTVRNSRMEIIKGKWMLGEHIEVNLKDLKGYGEYLSERIAADLNISEREVNRCRQMYRYCLDKFKGKDWDTVSESIPEEENISWHRITREWLPLIPPPACQHRNKLTIIICARCRKRIS